MVWWVRWDSVKSYIVRVYRNWIAGGGWWHTARRASGRMSLKRQRPGLFVLLHTTQPEPFMCTTNLLHRIHIIGGTEEIGGR